MAFGSVFDSKQVCSFTVVIFIFAFIAMLIVQFSKLNPSKQRICAFGTISEKQFISSCLYHYQQQRQLKILIHSTNSVFENWKSLKPIQCLLFSPLAEDSFPHCFLSAFLYIHLISSLLFYRQTSITNQLPILFFGVFFIYFDLFSWRNAVGSKLGAFGNV